MGRSVETVGNHVIYFNFSYAYEDDYIDLAAEDWDDMQINIIYALKAKYKSLINVQKWVPYPYRESAIILENDHVQISISEYCGCGAISIFVRLDTEYPELAEHWLDQTWDGIQQIIGEYVTTLRKIGTFSNGESIYEKNT